MITLSWKDLFIEKCRIMAQNNLTVLAQSEQGQILFEAGKKCDTCGNAGVYTGSFLEIDDMDNTAGFYCLKCGAVEITRWIHSDENLLSIMKKRFVRWPNLLSKAKRGQKEAFEIGLIQTAEPCPKCKSTIVFYRNTIDCSADSYNDNCWHVCPNPDCDWPGEFSFTSGSYLYG